MIKKGNVANLIQTDEFYNFDYIKQPIKDSEVEKWRAEGYTHSDFTGAMYGGTNPMPSWVQDVASEIGLHTPGFTFYKMSTLEIMPPHIDHFETYCQVFNIPREKVFRAIVFLEDWKPGHYFEYNKEPFTGWKKGDYVLYSTDVTHAASNIGIEPRYTLQITGTHEVILSLEPRDVLTGYFLANGASPSWYTEEENRFSIPKMWAWWELFGSKQEEFIKRWELDPLLLENLVTPFLEDDRIAYRSAKQITHQKHIYFINISITRFFEDNEEIGFKCISPEYQEDLRNGKAKLVLYHPFEGDSGDENSRDLEIIDKWVKDAKFVPENIFYVHGNLNVGKIAKEKNYSFVGVPYIYFDHTVTVPDEDSIPDFTIQDDKYLFLHYARMPRKHRVEFTNMLLKEGLLDKGKASLGKFPHFNNPDFFELERRTPLEIDTTLKYNLMGSMNLSHYSTTFISLLSETKMEDGTLFLSEKTFKTIAAGHPFIMLGSKDSLHYLRSQGYRTFGKWINERYDDESNYQVRLQMALEELKKFSTKSPEELQLIRKEMEEVLIHNRQVLRASLQNKYKDKGKQNPIIEFLQSIY